MAALGERERDERAADARADHGNVTRLGVEAGAVANADMRCIGPQRPAAAKIFLGRLQGNLMQEFGDREFSPLERDVRVVGGFRVRKASALPQRLKQEPRAALTLVDPVLDHAGGGGITGLVGEVVHGA